MNHAANTLSAPQVNLRGLCQRVGRKGRRGLTWTKRYRSSIRMGDHACIVLKGWQSGVRRRHGSGIATRLRRGRRGFGATQAQEQGRLRGQTPPKHSHTVCKGRAVGASSRPSSLVRTVVRSPTILAAGSEEPIARPTTPSSLAGSASCSTFQPAFPTQWPCWQSGSPVQRPF